MMDTTIIVFSSDFDQFFWIFFTVLNLIKSTLDYVKKVNYLNFTLLKKPKIDSKQTIK